jgi:hypothetical protein
VHYEEVLQGKNIKSIFEVGIGKGAMSLRMWAEFFPQAIIYGIDNDKEFLIDEGNIRSFFCDQSNPERIRQIIQDNEIVPNVFIDDGPHVWSFQISTYNVIWPLLNSGSIYIVEDLHTSCIWPQCWKNQEERPLDFFSALNHFTIIKTNWNKLFDSEILELNAGRSINYSPLDDSHADDLRKVGVTGIGIKE